MRIVYVTQSYPPERVGGVEVYVKNLARELARGHEVFVFSRGVKPASSHGEVYEEDDGPVRVTRVYVDLRQVGEFRDNYMRPWLTGLFREYLKRVGPEVVHFQHLGGMSLDMPRAAAELGAPVVMTLSDHQPYCPRGQRIRNDKRVCKKILPDECLECLKPQTAGIHGRPGKLAAYLMGKAKGQEMLRRMREDIAEQFGAVSCFIMPSESHRRIMVEEGVPAERARVLPYGLDLSELDKVPPRPAGQPVRRFGYLGTLIPSKGVEDVIRAFKKLKTPGCSLHMHGEAVPYHGILDYDKRLVELARSADISFYGAYQPADLPRVLATVDAIIMPSRWFESYGITIREAFRARRPVIVSEVGAFSEAVEHEVNGLRFAPGDVFELAAAMDRIAADPKLADRLAAAGGPIEGLPEHAAKLIEVYEGARNKD
jgi:glycosyltransferase involved in cell wall biosynthesis